LRRSLECRRELELEKEKKRVVKQAKKPIAKKVREVVKVVEAEKKKKAKSCKNTDMDEHLLKIEKDHLCE